MVVLIFDAILNDHIRYVIDGLRNALKLYLSHLDRFKQEAVETALKVLPLGDILRKDQLVHILLNRVDSLQVVLDIHQDLSDSLVDTSQLISKFPDLFLGILPFGEDMVIAFVLLELKGFDDE
jgi:hypothetical protein